MNFQSDGKSKGISSLELTPLVDVVFLLLIFFLLTATYVKNPNLDINLPKATAQEVFNKTKDVTIAIKENGDIKYENKVVSVKQLEGILGKRHKEDGVDTVVIIKADKGAKHGKVVEVMDLAKKVGFAKLAIAVQSPAPVVESEE